MHSGATHDYSNGDGTHPSGEMRIGELVTVSGVTRETIHFYLREGLLPPPRKVNARVSYFGPEHLARLQVIQRMRQAHLPLTLIRKQLEVAEGQPADRITEQLLPLLVEFLSLDGEEPEISADAVAAQSGLTLEQLAQLETLGVVRPARIDGHGRYTQADADAAAAARLLLDQGVELEALQFLQRHKELIEQEHGFIFHYLIKPAVLAGRRDQVSARKGFRAIRLIEAYLRRQFRRQLGVFGDAYQNLPDPLAHSPSQADEGETEYR